MQIKLRQDAVQVSVHDSIADGGHTKQEWPWKLLYDNQGPSDKWVAPGHSSGWVVYKFKKPLLIRAYGLKSANDCPVRDPKKFTFTVHDVMDERPKEDQDFVAVHEAEQQFFNNRWQTNIYRLKKAVFASAVKLIIHEVQGEEKVDLDIL